jgi:hypothetical protein
MANSKSPIPEGLGSISSARFPHGRARADRIGPAINLKTAEALGVDFPATPLRARCRLYCRNLTKQCLRLPAGSTKRCTVG